MKFFKKILGIVCFAIFLSISLNNTYANVFNDINPNIIGYNSIQKLANMGLIVGDLQGNFKPNSYVSKFEAIKTLAKLVPSENINIDESKYKNIVLAYDKKYTRWDSSSNPSMVVLLENNILKEDELKDFVILDKNNKEQIRALSKEEISLYLTRIEKKENEIESLIFDKKFNDEINIDKAKIKSCYYMNSLGIVVAKENNFYPKNPLTKSEFTVIIDKFLQHTNLNIKYSSKLSNIENNIQTRVVTISNVFTDSNSIQTKIGNESKIYNLSESASIYIDEMPCSLSSLKPSINAEITIKNNLVTKINAITNLKIQNIQNNQDDKKYGIIKNISKDSIALSYKELSENGFTFKETIDIIPIDKNCKITKNGITVNDIEENNIATIILDNKRASHIILEDDDAIFIGNIINIANPKITIKTADDKILELGFLENTSITRNDKPANIKDLKIGDAINLTTKKDKILSLNAKGNIYTKQGIIKSININENFSTIQLEDTQKNIISYYVNNSSIDIYSLKVLDKVNLYLDSYEVYKVDILDRKQNKSLH